VVVYSLGFADFIEVNLGGFSADSWILHAKP
jgi:hypothetical protein